MSKAYWNSDIEMLLDEDMVESWKRIDAKKGYKRFCETLKQRNEEFGINIPAPTFEEYCKQQNHEYNTPYKELTERAEHMKAMHSIIQTMNNEDAYMEWIYLVPDGATEEDFIDIADDDDMFDEACRLFCTLIRRYGKDGFYFGSSKAFGEKK